MGTISPSRKARSKVNVWEDAADNASAPGGTGPSADPIVGGRTTVVPLGGGRARPVAKAETLRIFSLWGAHRLGPTKTGQQPTSIDKGVPELSALGHEVVSIYPRLCRPQLPSFLQRLLRVNGRYVSAIAHLLAQIRPGDVIYTTDSAWATWLARLKRLGLLNNKVVFKWAGFDADYHAMKSGQAAKETRFFGNILEHVDVVFAISVNELRHIAATFPTSSAKLNFWPTAVDVDFYRTLPAAERQASSGLVAVGNDAKRDWGLIIELARRGVDVTIVTEDQGVARMIEALGDARPSKLNLAMNVGMRASAQIMADARALIISTLPNERFSGATTVGVAASLGKPLILDEPHDLEFYGLVPGQNCETFHRGNVGSALSAIHRVYLDEAYEGRLSANIGLIADDLDVSHYAQILSESFSPDWEKTSAVLHGADGKLKRNHRWRTELEHEAAPENLSADDASEDDLEPARFRTAAGGRKGVAPLRRL